jgi:hypothetical protein
MTQRIISSARYPVLALLLLASLVCSGCVTYFGYGGPYEGRVIDRDTRQPIEAAIIHGTWHKHSPCSKEAPSTYFNSQEVLSDKKGEFKVKGQGLRIMSCIDEMDVTVFKAGYTQQRSTPWSDLKNPLYGEDIELEAGRIIFKLRRMTLEERRKRGVTLPDTPDHKRQLFRIEKNRELLEIGTPSGTLPKE